MASFGTAGESTTLAADLSAQTNTMRVTSGTGFPPVGNTIANPGYPVRIDKEWMRAIQQPTAGVIKLGMRGDNGTAVVQHDILAKVEVSANGSDFANAPAGTDVTLPPYLQAQDSIGEDITYTTAQIAAWGNQARDFAINKGSAAAIVLVAPSKGQDGLTLVFTSLTAYAHAITATTLLGDGVSGSPHTTALFAAYVGATITLKVENGIYNVVSATGVTVS